MKSIQITNAGTVVVFKIQNVFRTLKNIYDEAFSAVDYSHTKKLHHGCLICISVPLNTPLKLQTKAIWATLIRYFWCFIINFEQIEHLSPEIFIVNLETFFLDVCFLYLKKTNLYWQLWVAAYLMKTFFQKFAL